MADVTLLPCPNPWCAPDNHRILYEHSTSAQMRIACACGLNGPYCDTRAEAIAAWNTRPAAALTPKQAAADEMFAKLDKVANWLESLAARSEGQIETCRFESLNDAYRADAKNYKATARDIRAALAKAGQP